MKDKIFNILVPTEEEVEIKGGKKRIVKRKIFPGYVMVEMIVSDDSWYVVRNTSGVTGFVGSGTKPEPLQDEEALQLLKQSSGEAPPRRRLTLKIGDKVRITSGPFVEFYGSIQEVNPEKEKIKVLVSIFGRETPVELDYGQAEKL
jgi:transcriptional antiterminator NusG